MIIFAKCFTYGKYQMEFKNKHIIVTGGANGIGRYVAETFMREGATVTIIDTDERSGESFQIRYEPTVNIWL